MENKLTEKIVNEVWGRWCSVPIVLMLSVILGVPIIVQIISQFSYIVTENGRTYSEPSNVGIICSILIVICFIGLNVWNIVFVCSNNCIKKAHKNKTGILIYVDACDRKTYDDTVRKFRDEFKNNLSSVFEDIYIPFGVKPIEYRSPKIIRLLRKKKCILFINIGINVDKDNNSFLYDMKIDGSIIHPAYKKNVKERFQKIFSSTLHRFHSVTFSSNEMIKKLRVTATEMSFACEYLVGLSMFFSGNFGQAETILEPLVKKSSMSEQWCSLRRSAQRIRYEMFMIRAMIQIEKYQRQCDDELALDEMNIMLEKAKECYGLTYEYCLNKAHYCIAKEQDAKKAKEYINMCKQMKQVPLIWKYSDAFLVAYENRSLATICSRYKNALCVDYNILDLIVFIERVLEKEPERIGLFLALGILYRRIDDISLSDKNIATYLSNVSDPQKAKTLLIKKGLF